MLDWALINGTIVDGMGNPGFRSSLGIKDGCIAVVGREVEGASETIDVHGAVIAPGFIDIHTHSCAALIADPRALSAVNQGVTTHVVGNCGYSLYPAADIMIPWFERFNVKCTWTDLRGYGERIRRQGTGINVVPLVGHGTVRSAVMGEDARVPTPVEMEEMKRIVACAMEQGAFGMSTGLIYPPGSFARTEEIVELARVVASYGGMYASHLRDEGGGLLGAVKEAISIGELAGVPVEISHLKAAGRHCWGLVRQALSILDAARARALDVTWDQYPYTATSSGLHIFLPGWAHEGGNDALRRRLRTPHKRSRIAAEMNQKNMNWSDVVILSCPGRPLWQGLTPVEIGEQMGLSPVEAVMEIILADESEVKMMNFAMCEEDVEMVMAHPVTMVGSDGAAVSSEGPLAHLRYHPRAYGNFPRLLGRYVRERRVLSLENAVYKMTYAPARRLGLYDRGLLAEGMRADITVFDPDRVGDRATFDDPQRYPDGIDYVMVNGEFVLYRGTPTEKLPGEFLMKKVRSLKI